MERKLDHDRQVALDRGFIAELSVGIGTHADVMDRTEVFHQDGGCRIIEGSIAQLAIGVVAPARDRLVLVDREVESYASAYLVSHLNVSGTQQEDENLQDLEEANQGFFDSFYSMNC